MVCPNCGKTLEDNARVCSGCGAELAAEAPAATPKRKKTWLVWVLVVAILASLLAGGTCVFWWQKENAYKQTLDTLTAVAFDGNFAEASTLAPAEFWTGYAGQLSSQQLVQKGDDWKFHALPINLQKEFGRLVPVQFESFRVSDDVEIISDREADNIERKVKEGQLSATYGITSDRVDRVRQLQVEFIITGTYNGIRLELTHPETLFAIRIDDVWYLTDEEGTFALARIVEDLLSVVKQ